MLVWNASPGATEYQAQIDDVLHPGITVYRAVVSAASVCSGSVCRLATGQGLVAHPYRWWIQARTGAGVGTWSTPLDFTVLPPAAPVAVSPSGPLANPAPSFSWTASPGATAYWLAVYGEGGALVWQGGFPASSCSGGTCTGNPGRMFPAGSYTWRVQAQSAAGETWSALVGFSLVTPVPPTPLSPNGRRAWLFRCADL